MGDIGELGCFFHSHTALVFLLILILLILILLILLLLGVIRI